MADLGPLLILADCLLRMPRAPLSKEIPMTATRDRIGGDLGLSALDALTGRSYDERAQRHRPTEPGALAAEIRRLHASGLTAQDVATALRVGLDQVRNALQGPEAAR